MAKLSSSGTKPDPLPRSFYGHDDVIRISRELLGKVLCTFLDGELTCGIITETEAYAGIHDRASHAYGNRRTRRNAPMYAEGGIAYVYLCYGLHHLFNVVTGSADHPTAVLIRALQPLEGIDAMLRRRKKEKVTPALTAGPGSLSQALGITVDLSGAPLDRPPLWIEDRGIAVPAGKIIARPRIGVAYAGEDAHKPWRFYIKDSPWVSRK